MSIATEISRLQTAKADLKTAIEGKGVTVPSATLLDGYADLVDSISGGGGTDYLPDLVQNTLTSYYNDEITSMKANAFNGNTNLVSIELPNCLTAALNAFSGCTSLNVVKLPKLRNFNGNTCFNSCTSLTVVVFPSLEGVSNTAFQNCSNLTVADLLVSTGGIGGNGVFSNSGLNTLIIRANRVASLGNVGCFNGTPFASGGTGGTIYIPKVLYDALGTGTNDYKAATNWSTIDGYGTITWAAIEGSQYENYYADGTPISA